MNNIQNTLKNRKDLRLMLDLIPDGVKVLDLGCGDGSFLKMLKNTKNVKPIGVENSQNAIIDCIQNGIPVINCDLNNGLKEFPDKSFDIVLLGRTLQAIHRPDDILKEMLRVGDTVVVSIINIGYYKSRFQLLFNGKMPETKTIPYKWYNTPNIHLSTINDFKFLCKSSNIKIIKEIYTNNSITAKLLPNLFAETAVFVIKNDNK